MRLIVNNEESSGVIATLRRKAYVKELCIEGTEAASNYVRGVYDDDWISINISYVILDRI